MQLLESRYVVDLEASIPIRSNLTLAVGGQNILNTFSERMDLFANVFGLWHSRFTPWGLNGG